MSRRGHRRRSRIITGDRGWSTARSPDVGECSLVAARCSRARGRNARRRYSGGLVGRGEAVIDGRVGVWLSVAGRCRPAPRFASGWLGPWLALAAGGAVALSTSARQRPSHAPALPPPASPSPPPGGPAASRGLDWINRGSRAGSGRLKEYGHEEARKCSWLRSRSQASWAAAEGA